MAVLSTVQRFLSVGLGMMLIWLISCQVKTEVTTPTPLLPSSQTGGCELGTDFIRDFASGAGYETAQQALTAWMKEEDYKYVPGKPVLEIETDELVVWALSNEAGQKVGAVHAIKAEWGLWLLEGGEWCLEGTYVED